MAPELPAQPAPPRYQPIGAVSAFEKEVIDNQSRSSVWSFRAMDGTVVEVSVLGEDVARIRLLPMGREAAQSWAVLREDGEWPAPRVVARDLTSPGRMTLDTPQMRVGISTQPFRVWFEWPDGTSFAEDDDTLGMGYVLPYGDSAGPSQVALGVRCHKKLVFGEHILGGGESTAPFDRRGQRLLYWNTDPPQPHGRETGAMYMSIPFWMGLRSGRCYGIFFDTVWKSELDAGATQPDQLSFSAGGGDLTYYVFAGPTLADVLNQYATMTGRLELPPRWALGYGQSRWSYFGDQELREVAANFRRREIPCDTLWLDIDYMDGYRDFTWNPDRFKEPQKLLRDLRNAGFKVIAIIDPCVKVDPAYPVFTEGRERGYFVRRADGSVFTGVVWPGESAFPDFSRADVRAWWGELHRDLLDAGIMGFWNDMNEPSLLGNFPESATLPLDAVHHPDDSGGNILAHEAFHNAYGMQMARATNSAFVTLQPDHRHLVLSRSGYAGIQRYACTWTGDNQSTWEHLRLASRMCLALGLSGVPFVGFDTGGFWENATGPLLVRSTQLGVVFPFFRNHSALGTRNQEPWAFGQPYEAMCRRTIELRYRLLPYIYSAAAESMWTGAPIARPLAYAYPDMEALLTVSDQHLLGSDLLCAPIMEEDQTERIVNFPPGTWVDWETGERISGPTLRRTEAPLDVLPLFVREGAVLPLGPVLQYVGEREDEPLTLACYMGEDERAQARGDLYEDDGDTLAYRRGIYRLTHFTVRRSGRRLIFVAEASGAVFYRDWTSTVLEFHLPYHTRDGRSRPDVAAANAEGRPIDVSSVQVIPRVFETLVLVPVGRLSPPCEVVVELADL